jgi:hypothetical protein
MYSYIVVTLRRKPLLLSSGKGSRHYVKTGVWYIERRAGTGLQASHIPEPDCESHSIIGM